jgi:hypothetical protein
LGRGFLVRDLARFVATIERGIEGKPHLMNTTTMVEQMGKYWGSTRSSSTTSPIIPFWASPYYSSEPSWEEQAFARDAAAHLGGCVWPPRSYSCSFCQREFRSAQALGGHMNVHRRDRALLRLGSSPDDGPDEQPKQQGPFLDRAASNPSTTAPPPPPPSYLASITKESKNKLFMTMRVEAADECDDDVELRMLKRRRLDPPLPIFVQTTVSFVAAHGVDHDAKVPKEIISNPSSILPLVDEQVDLELRLGTSPKVT